jgi:tetratricopeptide (TPR) repeat protein
VRLTAAFILISVFSGRIFCAEPWIKISAPHFELDTQLDREQALHALQIFEQTQAFFLQAGFGGSLAGESIKILDLGADAEYRRYLIKPGAYAMYQRGRRGDYIVISSLNPRHSQVAVHEYTHFVVEHAGLKLPIWLNEGLAELYSTMEPRGGECLIGTPEPARLLTLATRRRLPLETLLAVDESSPYYNDPDKMQIFYAESWALVHMLAVSENYSSRFNKFLSVVSSGQPAREALAEIYGKRLASIESDLDQYLARRSLPALLYNIRVETTPAEATVAALPKSELDLSVADLLSSNASAGAEAEAKLRELASAHPDEAGFEESLGYVALREHDTGEARLHFANAVERQSNDAAAVYNSARLQQDAGAPPGQTIPLLKRALALDPDYEPARIDLGFTAGKARQFELAVTTLSQLKTIQPRVAFEVYFEMAYCDAELRRLQDALTYVGQAREHARNAEQQQRADTLARFIERQEMASLHE